ncbi:MAG: FecR domain-containing protein [Woeseia sp.]
MKPSDNKKNDAITDEAADWFQAMRGDDVSEPTRQRFAEWLVQSPEHGSEYLRLAELWEDLGSIDPERRIDVQALIDEAEEDGNVTALFNDVDSNRSDRDDARRRRRRIVGVAATLVLSAGFLWFSSKDIATRETYATSLGEQRSFSLADGSIIHLNTMTGIRVYMTPYVRRIDLRQGEALFDVAHDAARPFIVSDNHVVAQALGTRFNVYHRDAGTQVTVIEGSVAVSAQQAHSADESQGGRIARLPRVELSPGEQAEVDAASILRTSVVDVDRATAWTARRLVFKSDRLADVVEQFNRYNAVELHLASDALAECRITSTFNANEPDTLVDALRSLLFDLEVERQPDGGLLLQLGPGAGDACPE